MSSKLGKKNYNNQVQMQTHNTHENILNTQILQQQKLSRRAIHNKSESRLNPSYVQNMKKINKGKIHQRGKAGTMAHVGMTNGGLTNGSMATSGASKKQSYIKGNVEFHQESLGLDYRANSRVEAQLNAKINQERYNQHMQQYQQMRANLEQQRPMWLGKTSSRKNSIGYNQGGGQSQQLGMSPMGTEGMRIERHESMKHVRLKHDLPQQHNQDFSNTSRNNMATISENNYDYNDFNFIVNKNKSSSKNECSQGGQ